MRYELKWRDYNEKGYLSLMIESLISGVIAGIIASAIFMFIMYAIRPKINISDNLTFEEVGNDTIIQVKITNMTRRMINNVRYGLYYCTISDDGINDIEEIPAKKSMLNNISAYNRGDEDAEYAIRISFVANDFLFPLDSDDKLLFVISANHSLSNTLICKKKEYHKDDIMVNGIFESGASLKAIKKEH